VGATKEGANSVEVVHFGRKEGAMLRAASLNAYTSVCCDRITIFSSIADLIIFVHLLPPPLPLLIPLQEEVNELLLLFPVIASDSFEAPE
jgi:hypothetical protein